MKWNGTPLKPSQQDKETLHAGPIALFCDGYDQQSIWVYLSLIPDCFEPMSFPNPNLLSGHLVNPSICMNLLLKLSQFMVFQTE
jgi:hypothetical protein